MLRVLYGLFLIVTLGYTMEVDFKMLQKIIDKNPHALKEKVILAKYYMDNGNDLKAKLLVESVLKEDSQNKNANVFKKTLEKKERNKILFRNAKIAYPVTSKVAQKYLKNTYEKNMYKPYLSIYSALMDEKVFLSDSYHIKAAYIYLWDGNYTLSANALDQVKQKNNLDKTKIEADICYFTGKYQCAVNLFEKLYSLNKDVDVGIKLVYSYYYIGMLGEAKRLYAKLFEKMPENKALKKVQQKFSKTDQKRKRLAKEKYEKKRDMNSLLAYCSLLYTSGEKEEALKVLKLHNKKYATDDSLLLEAQYLSWMQKFSESLQILDPLVAKNNVHAKLLEGQILSWKGDFEKSKQYLKEVITSTKDKKILYESKKSLAFVYKWEKKNTEAKKLFLELVKENKKDSEVIEALMELNGDYKGLIKIYKEKPSSGTNIKRLSELYFHDNQQNAAIDALKAYLKDKPEDLEATKNLALMLIDKKEYYSGFGNLEYYAAQKNDQNSSLLLAQQYYWHGFSKEAIDVLDRLLKKYPENKEAIKLRAKILKVSPRFTTSNSGATINDYFQTVGLKQLEIADALYFNGHHGASLIYYENYLSEEPDNHNVRLRYAFALENAGKYAKAEGEFALLLWNHDTDEIKYHYAYNLMMNNKLDKAEKSFLKLKQETFKPIGTPLSNFIDSWKSAWESKDFSRYEKYYSKKMRDDEFWSLSRQQNFSDTTFISVGLYDIVSRKTKKNNRYLVNFYEEVTTSKGTKKGNSTLEIVCGIQQSECQIDKESFTEGTYQKFVSLEPIINQRLKDVKVFRRHPSTLKKIIRKKKSP